MNSNNIVYPQYPLLYPIAQPEQPNQPVYEQSYIENILRLNKGRMATIYMNYENSQWGSKIYIGKLEAAGKDHIIISDPQTKVRTILLTIYLNYITFDGEINYEYPYNNLMPITEPMPYQDQQYKPAEVKRPDDSNAPKTIKELK